ncbi:hypothetical protein OG607_19770 [Streptomyces sp. NBC_01537]
MHLRTIEDVIRIAAPVGEPVQQVRDQGCGCFGYCGDAVDWQDLRTAPLEGVELDESCASLDSLPNQGFLLGEVRAGEVTADGFAGHRGDREPAIADGRHQGQTTSGLFAGVNLATARKDGAGVVHLDAEVVGVIFYHQSCRGSLADVPDHVGGEFGDCELGVVDDGGGVPCGELEADRSA